MSITTVSVPIGHHCRILAGMLLKENGEQLFKMNSRSSCIRYTFSRENGQKIVTEEKLLPVLGRFGIPSAVKSRGSISQMSANPAEMWVTWNTGLLREAMWSKMSYLVLKTDYNDTALVCSCQDLNLGVFAANRRSCDFLVRPSTDPPLTIPQSYVELLDSVSEDLAKDMKRIRQDKCKDLGRPSLDVGSLIQIARRYGEQATNIAMSFLS